jgi:hypothetical protein
MATSGGLDLHIVGYALQNTAVNSCTRIKSVYCITLSPRFEGDFPGVGQVLCSRPPGSFAVEYELANRGHSFIVLYANKFSIGP